MSFASLIAVSRHSPVKFFTGGVFDEVVVLVPRADSSLLDEFIKGLRLIDGKCGIAAVHDCTQPFADGEKPGALITSARLNISFLCKKVVDTLKIAENENITGTLDRNSFRILESAAAGEISKLKPYLERLAKEGVHCNSIAEIALGLLDLGCDIRAVE